MDSWLGLEGNTIIVTGGSSGIGTAIVDELLRQNVNVINLDIKKNEFQHAKLFFIETDLSSKFSIDQAVSRIMKQYTKIDGLVNNAGINMPRLLVDSSNRSNKKELTEQLLDRMYSINQKGLVLLSQAICRQMVIQGSGVIVNLSSESGLEGSIGQSIYAATKAAVNSYTRSWAKELGKYNIRVVAVAPGIMEETGLRTPEYEEELAYTRDIDVKQLRENYNNTSTIPLGRSGKLSEVADAICYLLSNRAGYITGVTINIAGGKTRG